MIYHFDYNNVNYSYDTSIGWIEKEDDNDVFFKYVPVFRDLEDMLVNSDDDTMVILLRSVLHAYHHGRFDGENDKLRDIRRVLGVNFN